MTAEPISDCQLKCEAAHVAQVCGCLPPYMVGVMADDDKNITYEECSMAKTFQCVALALSKFYVCMQYLWDITIVVPMFLLYMP